MKSYTDIEQSKKLSEILPIESADMCYKCIEDDPYDIVCKPYSDWKEEYKGLLVRGDANVIPCWSLAALMSIMPKEEDSSTSLSFGYYDVEGNYTSSWLCCYEKEGESTDDYIIETIPADNPIDACVNMIIWLKEQNLL